MLLVWHCASAISAVTFKIECASGNPRRGFPCTQGILRQQGRHPDHHEGRAAEEVYLKEHCQRVKYIAAMS